MQWKMLLYIVLELQHDIDFTHKSDREDFQCKLDTSSLISPFSQLATYTEKKMLLNQKHFFPKACIL